ncbi:hypothetical protein BgAZ_501780 [Babesia gibsoni]|uniref:Uncharacterized protein n=1 Tax=Babesia gibsoni TaxID=33632 RepID=A0AAD8LMG8_BABGI|nr:hypothetical protein BgAZ_501780 [Babesia gibsoni]
MNSGINSDPSRCLNVIFLSLYIVVLVTGISVGILFAIPAVQVKVHKDNIDAVGTWRFKLENNNIVTGATFTIPVQLYNHTVLPLSFNTEKVSFHYYPIGSHFECLKYIYGEYLSRPNVATLHRPITKETDDGLISLDALNVKVPAMGTNFKEYTVNVPFRAYFLVGTHDTNTLAHLKRMHNDCKKHNRLLLSMRIMDIKTRYWFIYKDVPLVYEIILPLMCEGIDRVASHFSSVHAKTTDAILGSHTVMPGKDVEVNEVAST